MPTENVLYSKLVYRQVLFGDCDPAGGVYAPRFSDFSLQAVHQVFDDWFEQGVKSLVALDILVPVRAISHEFFQPVPWGEELALRVNVTKVGQHSLTFTVDGRIASNNELPVTAFTSSITLVFIGAQSKALLAVPQQILLALTQ